MRRTSRPATSSSCSPLRAQSSLPGAASTVLASRPDGACTFRSPKTRGFFFTDPLAHIFTAVLLVEQKPLFHRTEHEKGSM